MDDLLDQLSAGASSCLKALAATSPMLVSVGASLGLVSSILFEYAAKSTNFLLFNVLSSHPWYEYSVIWIGFLCAPVLLGVTYIPKEILEQIASMQKIMHEGNFSHAQQRAFWADAMKVCIQNFTDHPVEKLDVRQTASQRETST